jgi:hypothetical protein
MLRGAALPPRAFMSERERQTRSAPSPTQTPACRGLALLDLPEARKRAAGWGRGGEGVSTRCVLIENLYCMGILLHAPSLSLQPQSDISDFGRLKVAELG